MLRCIAGIGEIHFITIDGNSRLRVLRGGRCYVVVFVVQRVAKGNRLRAVLLAGDFRDRAQRSSRHEIRHGLIFGQFA